MKTIKVTKKERSFTEQAAAVLATLPANRRSGPEWGKPKQYPAQAHAEQMLSRLPFAVVHPTAQEQTQSSSAQQAATVLAKMPGSGNRAQAQRKPDALDKMAQRLAKQRKG